MAAIMDGPLEYTLVSEAPCHVFLSNALGSFPRSCDPFKGDFRCHYIFGDTASFDLLYLLLVICGGLFHVGKINAAVSVSFSFAMVVLWQW